VNGESGPVTGPGPDPGPLERAGRWLETVLLTIVLGAMILLAASQVVLRGGFGMGLVWADEALRLLVLWAAMLGAVAASRDNSHLRIDLVSRFLPPFWRRASAILADLFAAALSAVLAFYSFRFVAESREFGDVVLGNLPAWALQTVMPVAFSLIAYRYVLRFIAHVRGLPGKT